MVETTNGETLYNFLAYVLTVIIGYSHAETLAKKKSHAETLGILVRMYCTNAVPKSFCGAKPMTGTTHDSLLSSWEDLLPVMLNCFTFFKQVLRILLPRNDVKWFGGSARFRLKFFFSPTEMEMVGWYSYEALGHSTSERQVLDLECCNSDIWSFKLGVGF